MYIFRTSLERWSLLVLCRICQILTPGTILRSQTCSHLIILVSVVNHILLLPCFFHFPFLCVQLKNLCFENQFYNSGTGCYFLFPYRLVYIEWKQWLGHSCYALLASEGIAWVYLCGCSEFIIHIEILRGNVRQEVTWEDEMCDF